MNLFKAILLKVASALVFAVMSVLVRWLGDRYPVGQVVFFRSAFAVLPVVVIYAWRGELIAALRIGRPIGHLGRGLTAVGAMFCNFTALALLPVVDATAISFVAPLFAVALSALVLKERVRIYRSSAVFLGFSGVLVMLLPHLDIGRSATYGYATLGLVMELVRAVFQAASTIQNRALTTSESTSSIVLYFSLICTIAGLATWPLGWLMPNGPELVALIVIGICGGVAHILLTESYRLAPASLIAPFDYTSMLWALVLGFLVFEEVPSVLGFVGAGIVAAAGLFVIWRERRLGLKRGLGRASE